MFRRNKDKKEADADPSSPTKLALDGADGTSFAGRRVEDTLNDFSNRNLEKGRARAKSRDVKAELEYLYQLLDERERDLQVSAELGQLLLAKGGEARTQNERLGNENANLLRQVNEFKQMMDEDTRDVQIVDLREQLDVSDEELARLKDRHKSLEQTNKECVRRNTFLNEELTKIERQLEETQDELSQKISEFAGRQRSSSVADELLLERKEWEKKEELLTAKSERLKVKVDELSSDLMSSNADVEALTETQEKTVKENTKLKRSVKNFVTVQTEVAKLRETTFVMREEAEDSGRDMATTRLENKALKEKIEELDQIREHLTAQKEILEQDLMLALKSAPEASGGIGKEILEARTRSAPKPGDERWTEEVFTMIVMAVKLGMNQLDEELLAISTKDLYKDLRKKKIPFHEWFPWLRKRITQLYIQALYEASTGEACEDPDAPPDEFSNFT